MRPGDLVYILPELKRGIIVKCWSKLGKQPGWYRPDYYSPHDMINILVNGKVVTKRRINVRKD